MLNLITSQTYVGLPLVDKIGLHVNQQQITALLYTGKKLILIAKFHYYKGRNYKNH